jgi:hypothetical protein
LKYLTKKNCFCSSSPATPVPSLDTQATTAEAKLELEHADDDEGKFIYPAINDLFLF